MLEPQRALFVRCICKAWELTCRAVTAMLRVADRDPTQILLDKMTPAQHEAAASLVPAAPLLRSERLLVVIPFRDKWDLTDRCLNSLMEQTFDQSAALAPRIHVVLVDNGSVEPATREGLTDRLVSPFPAGFSLEVLRVDAPFNFSALNNQAVAHAKSFDATWILFLNNDIELPHAGCLQSLMRDAARVPKLGVLGATLSYPDGALQHLFLAPGVKIVAAHPLKGRHLAADCAWFAAPRPVAAVTGAVMLLRADAFAAAKGFDEALPTVGQDLDLCLKLQALGLVNWVSTSERLVHHEGASRRHRPIDRGEVQLLYERWGTTLTRNPYFSARFSRWSEPPALALIEPPYPWRLVLP